MIKKGMNVKILTGKDKNKTGEIIWKFTKNLNLQMACNIPGHYESGMYGKIVLE